MMASNDVMKGHVNQTPGDASDDAESASGTDVQVLELQLKKQSRRRLIGAVALTLFGVITLPMVMDSQPRPVAPDIQIHIPSQDAPGFNAKPVPAIASGSKTAPVPPAPVAAKTESSAAVNVAAKEPGATEQLTKSATGPDAENKKVADIAPTDATKKPMPADSLALDKPSAAKPKERSVKTIDSPKKMAESTPVGAQSSEEPRALAAVTGTESLSVPWVVQLGAYKEAGNVKVLMAKVKEMKIPVTSEKFESTQGPRTRVKAGPFATRAEAEKAQVRIRTIGVVGVLSQ